MGWGGVQLCSIIALRFFFSSRLSHVAEIRCTVLLTADEPSGANTPITVTAVKPTLLLRLVPIHRSSGFDYLR